MDLPEAIITGMDYGYGRSAVPHMAKFFVHVGFTVQSLGAANLSTAELGEAMERLVLATRVAHLIKIERDYCYD